MSAQTSGLHVAVHEPLDPRNGVLDRAREHVAATALHDGPIGLVGLELEAHLVDLDLPARRPTWAQVQHLLATVPAMPSGSTVTAEPGGQLELSTPPAPTIAAAAAALQRDRAELGTALASTGFGAASIGTDPARPIDVINRTGRYGAMHRHFAAVGCGGAGRAMMSSTAALQVNLDAGPAAGWRERVDHLHRLGPVLTAISACSPMLARHASGWRSMRQQVWAGLDQGRTAPIGPGEPGEAWATYALAAPVMLVRDPCGRDADPVPSRVSFASWLTGEAKLVRRPTLADLDYHLTTLFPPVRPRGYLELRYLDAVPDQWWPALAAITAILADDPVASDRAAEACEPVADHWLTAARDGLSDANLRRAAIACVDISAARCPDELRADVGAYAELVSRGRTPGDDLHDRISATDPLRELREQAHA
jgi:glutamate--cysteine ligase